MVQLEGFLCGPPNIFDLPMPPISEMNSLANSVKSSVNKKYLKNTGTKS